MDSLNSADHLLSKSLGRNRTARCRTRDYKQKETRQSSRMFTPLRGVAERHTVARPCGESRDLSYVRHAPSLRRRLLRSVDQLACDIRAGNLLVSSDGVQLVFVSSCCKTVKQLEQKLSFVLHYGVAGCRNTCFVKSLRQLGLPLCSKTVVSLSEDQMA